MRIVSLVPSATEMLFALGLGTRPYRRHPRMRLPARSARAAQDHSRRAPAGLTSAEIDAAVKERTLAGESIYELDTEMLHDLRPDLIVTQALCSVCAVSYDDVRAVAEEIETQAARASRSIRTPSARSWATRAPSPRPPTARTRRWTLVRDAAARIDRVRLAVRRVARRPRVAALEWLDPPFAAGHWTPQLIEYAGGEDVLGFAGEHSEQRTWDEVAAARAGHCDRDAVRL